MRYKLDCFRCTWTCKEEFSRPMMDVASLLESKRLRFSLARDACERALFDGARETYPGYLRALIRQTVLYAKFAM